MPTPAPLNAASNCLDASPITGRVRRGAAGSSLVDAAGGAGTGFLAAFGVACALASFVELICGVDGAPPFEDRRSRRDFVGVAGGTFVCCAWPPPCPLAGALEGPA